MKTKFACDLEIGDIIGLPKNLVPEKARITSIEILPTSGGEVLVLDLESKGGFWSISKAKIGFRANEKVNCIPVFKPWRERFYSKYLSFLAWCFPV